jgi:UDP:flavonoid glycosyltransferase YjiC (YdhE family)
LCVNAEGIDWVKAAAILGLEELTSESLERTLGSVLKYREDYEVAQEKGFKWVVGG